MHWWGATRHTHDVSQLQNSRVLSSGQLAQLNLLPGDYLRISRLDTRHARAAAGTDWTSVEIKDLSSKFDFLSLTRASHGVRTCNMACGRGRDPRRHWLASPFGACWRPGRLVRPCAVSGIRPQ